MIISKKQHQANALTEDPEEYQQLLDDVVADWQPANCTQRLPLECMATSPWPLAGPAESRVHLSFSNYDDRYLARLANIAKRRGQLERAYRTAVQALIELQRNRLSRPQPPPVEPAKTAAAAPVPPPAYVMSEAAADSR